MADTLPNDTDEELMLRYGGGDLPAFRELYRRHREGLYRFVAWRSPRRAWVDEIVQDAWASLHAARAGYQPQAAFRTWLYQLARNRLIDILRQKEALWLGAEVAPEVPSEAASPQQSFEQKQQHALLHAAIALLHAAIALLPAEQKEALVLQQFSAMSIAEIAVVTGAETETVKSRLRYAMQKLRAQLDAASGKGVRA